jgi:hypothetical protein
VIDAFHQHNIAHGCEVKDLVLNARSAAEESLHDHHGKIT